MITREEALHASSPTLWGMATAAAGVILVTVGWNVWENRNAIADWFATAWRL